MAKPTKHHRRMAVKAVLLDTLVNDLLHVEFEAGDEHSYGLTPRECDEVRNNLADQLGDWAVRITPLLLIEEPEEPRRCPSCGGRFAEHRAVPEFDRCEECGDEWPVEETT